MRTEKMVHSLEHGAVWITYNPEQISGSALDALRERVQDQSYLTISPYPGLDSPISLQSWGHQLKLADPEDKRIDQFILSLRANEYTSAEPGGPCDVVPTFDPANPPPFDAEPPGPDAVPLDYSGKGGAAGGTINDGAPPGEPPADGDQPAPVAPPTGG